MIFYHLIELPFICLIDDVKFVLVCLLDDLILGFCYRNLDTGNQWTRTTSEPTNKDADLRAIQQIVFQGVVGGDDNTKIRLYTILKQSKEKILEF